VGFDKSKWYLLTWRDDAPYHIDTVFRKEYAPEEMILGMTDPYGANTMFAINEKDMKDLLEWSRPEKDTGRQIAKDQALSAYGYCTRYLDKDEVLQKKDGYAVEPDYEKTKEQHLRYRNALLEGWNVPSWQMWRNVVIN